MAHFVRQAVYKGEFIFYFEVWNNGSFDDLVFSVVKKKLWPPPPPKKKIISAMYTESAVIHQYCTKNHI